MNHGKTELTKQKIFQKAQNPQRMRDSDYIKTTESFKRAKKRLPRIKNTFKNHLLEPNWSRLIQIIAATVISLKLTLSQIAEYVSREVYKTKPIPVFVNQVISLLNENI